MADEQAAKEAQTAEAATETAEENPFDQLLQREFRPQTEDAAKRIEGAVTTLAEQALANTGLVSDDAIKSIQLITDTIASRIMQGRKAGEVEAEARKAEAAKLA